MRKSRAEWHQNFVHKNVSQARADEEVEEENGGKQENKEQGRKEEEGGAWREDKNEEIFSSFISIDLFFTT